MCSPLFGSLFFFFHPRFNIVVVTMQSKRGHRKKVWVSSRGAMEEEGGQSQDLSDLLGPLEEAWPGPC